MITIEDAVKNDYNLSPSRYITINGEDQALPLEDAIILLKEAEEERASADNEFNKAMDKLRVGAWRHG